MKSISKMSIGWEITIPDSSFIKLYGRGAFYFHNKELILAYNQSKNYPFHEKGKLVKLSRKKIIEIFETKSYLWAPIIDNDDIYLTTAPVVRGDESEKGILYKINSQNTLAWQRELDGEASSLPVVYQDSIFITDFVRARSLSPRKSGHIYRFRHNGDLLMKKPIYHFNTIEPWILKKKEQIVLSFRKPSSLVVLDFKGNIKNEKIGTSSGFSENNKGDLFATVSGSIVALDDALNIRWEYKPDFGFADMAPVSDSEGNLYSKISGNRLVSLDASGRERWITSLSGHGYQPWILANGNVFSVTSDTSRKGVKQEQFVSYIEIFSNQGEKLSSFKLPGDIFHTEEGDKNTVFVGTNSCHVLPEEESESWAIKVFSLNLE
jgi:hypothetical protein